jgi:hypothetical protein
MTRRAAEDIASTEDEAAKVLDEMREYSREWCATAAQVGHTDDDWAQGPVLLIGVNDDIGFVTYGGGDGGPVTSYGSDVGGAVTYSYKFTPNADLPASVEIPFETVKQAVIEFLVSEGGRPPCVPAWQPDPLP